MSTYAKMGEGGTHPESAHSGKPPTLGIYIQVPFCQTKCTYCNFHTGVASPAAYAPYARAVEREIRDWRTLHSAAHLASAARLDLAITDTIYLGGGTPSLFDPNDLARILEAVRSRFANPG